MKYDDASWHYGGDFPSELPEEAGATHIGMFVVWAFLSGLAADMIELDCPEMLQTLELRAETPAIFMLNELDGKFVDEVMNEEGANFAKAYYEPEESGYLKDYEEILCNGIETMYHVADTWENFDRLKPRLDQRLSEWQAK